MHILQELNDNQIIHLFLFGFLMLAIWEFIKLIRFTRKRKEFYEDYVSFFQQQDRSWNNFGEFLLGIFALLVFVLQIKFRIDQSQNAGLEKDVRYYYCFLIVYGLLSILWIINHLLVAKMENGIGATHLSYEGKIYKKEQVVFTEEDDQVHIYKKCRGKKAFKKIVSSKVSPDENRREWNYLHIYYKKRV
ncbi:hypothetical protein [Anaerosporobacter faecicola]|uniref:hypothetical protein n=1 Tax=Anaerosporobacter faecicola TaxID=2718714 RepID=UPI001439AD83|nr:hypothetical protein [Anaerosporobacter faecicola]